MFLTTPTTVGHCIFGWTNPLPDRQTLRMGAAILLLFALMGAPLPAFATGVRAVEVVGGEVRLSFDGPVAGIQPMALAGPDRIVLDVEAADRTGRPLVRSADPAVTGVRAAQFDATTTRVVLDLARPASVRDAQWTEDGRRVTLRLASTSPAEFTRSTSVRAASFAPPALLRRLLAPPKYKISSPVRPARVTKGLPEIAGPAGRPLVVIDAGHGGHDPGSISPHGGVQEKEVTLAIARAVRDRLLATGRMRVALTRSDDRFIVLQQRFGIARQLGAELFISIHADSAENQEARGATIYTLSEVSSDREAARLAARENRADIISGIDLSGQGGDVANILIGLTQRETMNVSARFAGVLHRESSDVRFKPGFHRFASLMVLKAPDVASVLYETGYMSNEDDVAWLTSASGRRAIAEGVAKAVSAHFARQVAAR